MSQAIVSNDYRIEIPEEIRREISLATGHRPAMERSLSPSGGRL